MSWYVGVNNMGQCHIVHVFECIYHIFQYLTEKTFHMGILVLVVTPYVIA